MSGSCQRPESGIPALARLTFLCLLAGIHIACGGGSLIPESSQPKPVSGTEAANITVFAAASLIEAFEEISQAYEEDNPGHTVRLNFDGSQRLSIQLQYGASADAFASADWAQMESLREEGILASKPVNFASNELVLLVNSRVARSHLPGAPVDGQPAGYGFATAIRELADPGARIVLGSPESPIGAYSALMLNKLAQHPEFGQGPAEGIKANIVSRENSVRSVAQKVALGEADAGITYRTDALHEAVSKATVLVDIPESLNVAAQYPMAALTDSVPARLFVDYVLADRAQAILESHGFGRADLAAPSNP